MLTNKQVAEFMSAEGLSIESLNDWAIASYLKAFNTAYAAGAKDMKERCAKLVDTHEWVGDAVYDIKALETT